MIKNIFEKRVVFMEKVKFEVKLVHDEPVDLIEMANSLIALNNISLSHIGREKGIKDTKILLQGVKQGCDIYQLVLDFGAGVLPIIDGISSVKDIFEYVNSYKKIDDKTIEQIRNDKYYNAVEASNIKSFVAPIKESNASIQVTVNGTNNAPILIINNNEAKEITENAKFIENILSNKEEDEIDKKTFSKVLIKMYSMKDTDKQVRDSSYCDDIIKGRAIPTIIENKEDKHEMLPHAFNSLFLVDIDIVKADGEIKLYRVTKLHNILPNE